VVATVADDFLGRVVTSRAGRDRGHRYVVVGAVGPDMVLVVDGERRGVDRPKKKNVKHLTVHGVAPAVKDKLDRGQALRDEEIRGAIETVLGDPVEGTQPGPGESARKEKPESAAPRGQNLSHG